jgi:poly-gamma-glutamate capsule biosynthesis protein CapA/YwtB (metallophosphatase superfamily)
MSCRTSTATGTALSRSARQLKDIGLDVVAVANNHGSDYGVEEQTDTAQILRQAGLLSVGSGRDLAEARAPALAGVGARRIAIVAATSSATAESRATPSQADINARPGFLRQFAHAAIEAGAGEAPRRRR